ncbi:thioesterase [Bradyrhizobium sp. SSBR45G]|uniref:PaaI family thioesterase n=1 Tax=unclassified Bradyrhizobium TaxID=2631580 RepID=UPI002342ADD3|nr:MULTISPECIES: PaaI family thioesterase [unclassified Bradyrhizobium]GLH78866.1 thioesterase [Bradyrhizobium sp. SSBR45G]GLH86420.1 thioesterase [Bradyrhizobium sp. SSBR45R]
MNDRIADGREFGVVPLSVLASMPGLDFVRGVFADTLPQPPIMQFVQPFDCTAEAGHVVMHSVPGLRHYNPIGSVHGGYAAILLDSAMGLAVQTMCPKGSGYTTLEFKISFIKAMTDTTGTVRTEGKTLSFGRRAATAEARITDSQGRLLAHATTTCLVFELPKA